MILIFLFDLGEVYRPELKLSMEDEDFETSIIGPPIVVKPL